jgi:hypothetical protein
MTAGIIATCAVAAAWLVAMRLLPDRSAGRWLPARAADRTSAERPESLRQSEALVANATDRALEASARLRPRLTAVAHERLRRHGIAELDEPGARSLLGAELADFLTARGLPDDRTAPGLPLAQIDRFIARLENL